VNLNLPHHLFTVKDEVHMTQLRTKPTASKSVTSRSSQAASTNHWLMTALLHPNQFRQLLLQNVPLRLVLIVPFVLQISVAVGLTGWLSLRNGQQSVNDVVAQLQSETSDRIRQYLLNYLEKPQLIHEVTVTAIRSGKLRLSDLPSLELYFWDLVKRGTVTAYNFGNDQGVFLGVERLDENGQIVAKVRTLSTAPNREIYNLDERGRRQELVQTKKYDPRTRPWYEAAIAAKKPTWSPVYPLAITNFLAAAISSVTPIYSETGVFQGVLSINLNLTQISEFLKSIKIGKNGQTFIIERSGDLIASSTIKQPFVVKNDQSERLQAIKADNPLVSATAQHLLERFGNLKAIQQSQQLNFNFNGEKQFVQVLPFKDDYGLDWLIVVVVPQSDFMERIAANTRLTILLCLAALGVATIVGVLTSRWISEPILQLSQASKAIAAATSVNESSVQELHDGASQQALEIEQALQQIEQMTDVVYKVAVNAKQAETAMQQAIRTVEEGDIAMNRTVDGIQAIHTTVTEMAEKVKHLGEASQRISAVVELINRFANQTNLLALNASIEASKAGESSKGFAVIAAEVRALAQQSAEATKEIRELVTSIQAETNEVVAAMESSKDMVVAETQLVDETRQSLNKITATSAQIDKLIATTAQATVVQSQVAETVTKMMQDVAAIANKTSTEAEQVSSAFDQLRQVAQELQAGADRFKVN
jgi:methyl-accepting chemotaxis protein